MARCIALVAFVLVAAHSRAQHPKDRIPSQGFNANFLNHLIKTKIDSVRTGQGLSALANDSVLHVASLDHCAYLVRTKKLSHYEKDIPEKKDPTLRVKFHGGENYRVGENIARTYVHKTLRDKKGRESINTTYEDVANNFVKMWVNSPGHYANIITPDFEVTAVTTILDTSRNEVRVVQKFAEVQFRYDFVENKTLFPYSDWVQPPRTTSFENVSTDRVAKRFEWGLKAPKDSLEFCKDCNTAVDTNIYKNRLLRKGNRLVFTTPNIGMMHRILDSRRNGLALELVPYKPVDCGNPEYYDKPSRRNKQHLYNGRVLKPIYRKDLKRGFKRSGYTWYSRIRKKGTPTHFEYTLGRMPRDLGGYSEANVIVIRKKKVCRVMHFSDACGEEMFEFYDIPYLTKLNTYQFDINPSIREISFRIPFEQGKARYDFEDIKPLIDSVTSETFSVISADISAYSSLEGNKEINLALQRSRAASIIRALENHQRSEIEATISTDENWKVFRDQIAEARDLKPLRDLTDDQIRARLTDDAFVRKIENYLAEQRYAQVKLTVKVDVTDKGMGDILVKKFNRHMDSVNADLKAVGMTKSTVSHLDTMAGVQWYMYHLIKNGKVDTTRFQELQIPMNPDFAKLIKDHLWYDLDIHGSGEGNEKWERDFYWQLNRLDRLGISSFEIRYDVANYLVRNWRKRVPYQGDVDRLMDNVDGLNKQANTDEYRDLCAKLKVNFHFANANYRHFEKRTKDNEKMRESMEAVFDYFKENQHSHEEAYRLGSFFIWGEQDDLAYNVLQPKALEEEVFPPLIILYAKILFTHPEEYHDLAYYKYLISLREKLNRPDWCSMFVGPCNISFQALDYEPLRDFYCKECAGIPNYAQSPEEWEK